MPFGDRHRDQDGPGLPVALSLRLATSSRWSFRLRKCLSPPASRPAADRNLPLLGTPSIPCPCYGRARDTCRATLLEGTRPRTLKLTQSTTSPSGVIIASYERDGEVKTGTF